jgi:topoisomerase IV subunit B
MAEKHSYNEDSIKSLDWKEHIRLRPGMYIGKLGDGSSQDDGIYVLVKEILDNCIDEHMMGYGKSIDIKISEHLVEVRDFGRGIPLGKVIDCVSKINTGGKYDSGAFQKSVGLNGVGTKAVNALSAYFKVQSIREGKTRVAEFERGVLKKDHKEEKTEERNGTFVSFKPDDTIFKHYHYIPEFLEDQLWNYAFLNAGLTINYNGKKFHSEHGLLDLLKRKTNEEGLRYPIIHIKGDEIEMAMSHGEQYGEEYYSFVNGQNTTQGGTHLAAFREAVVKTVREFYKKDFEASDVRASIVAAIAVRVQEPVFESQTKTKLGSINAGPDGPAIRTWINDFVKKELDNYLHKNPSVADSFLKSAKERISLVLKSLPTKEQKKLIFTIKSFVIAEPILKMKRVTKDMKPPFLLPRVIQQADRLPNQGTWKHRLFSVCVASR